MKSASIQMKMSTKNRKNVKNKYRSEISSSPRTRSWIHQTEDTLSGSYASR